MTRVNLHGVSSVFCLVVEEIYLVESDETGTTVRFVRDGVDLAVRVTGTKHDEVLKTFQMVRPAATEAP